MSLTEPPAPLGTAVRAGVGPALPLPLPLAGWGVCEALLALDEARLALPPLPARATVVSALTTVVLRSGEHAVKVYPPGTDPAHLDRIATALAGSSCAVLPETPAVPTSYGVVTLAPWTSAVRPLSWPGLGGLLRAFHDRHAGADLPPWRPLSRLPSQVAGLAPEEAAVLLGAREALLAALGEVTSALGVGVVHGDPSSGNAMSTAAGPRLIDLDWAARAPREYDLAAAARRFRAGAISRRAYVGFCRAYGADVLSWPGLPVLDRIAELGGVAFRLWDCRHHGRELDWVKGEVALWRAPI